MLNWSIVSGSFLSLGRCCGLIMLIGGDIGNGMEDILVQGGGLLALSYSRAQEARYASWHTRAPQSGARVRAGVAVSELNFYQTPVFGIESHGSCGGSGDPFCRISIEMPSGERTKAILPSRGGRLITTPLSCSFWQVA
jgi:hypothetical protein